MVNSTPQLFTFYFCWLHPKFCSQNPYIWLVKTPCSLAEPPPLCLAGEITSSLAKIWRQDFCQFKPSAFSATLRMAPAALRHSEKPQGWPAQASNELVDPVVEMPITGMECTIINTVEILNTVNIIPGYTRLTLSFILCGQMAKTWFKTNVPFSKTMDTNINNMGLTVNHQ